MISILEAAVLQAGLFDGFAGGLEGVGMMAETVDDGGVVDGPDVEVVGDVGGVLCLDEVDGVGLRGGRGLVRKGGVSSFAGGLVAVLGLIGHISVSPI